MAKGASLFANRYRIEKCLGTGGMGSVYLASDHMLDGERVALKVLHPQFVENEKLQQRFIREVKVTRRVTDAHVVRTFDVGKEGELLFFTMEFAGGVTLKEKYGNQAVPYKEACILIKQICKGLDAIHQAGIIHRDLKAGNIIINKSGCLKITDFGVARHGLSNLTAHDCPLGSISCISPEVWEGKEVSAATDIYALGVLCYKLLTGFLPFDGNSPAELMRKHLADTAKAPKELVSDIPSWLSNLIITMLAKRPESRPQSAIEVLLTIEEWLESDEEETVNGLDELSVDELQHAFDSKLFKKSYVEPTILKSDNNNTRKIKARLSKVFSDRETSTYEKRSLLKISLYFFSATALATLIIYLLSTALGSPLLDAWSNLSKAEELSSIIFIVAGAIGAYGIILSLPVVIVAFSRGIKASSLIAGALYSLGILVLLTVFFNINCLRVGREALSLNKEIDTEQVQWIAEATLDNIIEVALLMPLGTKYIPINSNPDIEPTATFDPVLNFRGGYTRSELYFSDSLSGFNRELALFSTEQSSFSGSAINYLLWFINAFLLSFVLLRYCWRQPITHRLLVNASILACGLLLLAGLQTLIAMSLADLEFLFAEEQIFSFGPFYQSFSIYNLMCSAINWGLVMSLVIYRSYEVAQPE